MAPTSTFRHCGTALGAMATLAAIGFGAPASAQGADTLTPGEMAVLLTGRVLTHLSDKYPVGQPPIDWLPRRDGGHSIVEYVLRPDHSVRVRCTNFARDGATGPCRGVSANDVGVWSIEADAFCVRWLNWGASAPRCYRFRHEGDAFRAERIAGGPSSMDGVLVRVK